MNENISPEQKESEYGAMYIAQINTKNICATSL